MQTTPLRARRQTASTILLAAFFVAAGNAFTPTAGAQQQASSRGVNVLAVGTGRTEFLNSADIVQRPGGSGVSTQVTFTTTIPSPELGSVLAYALAGKPEKSRLTIASVDVNSNRVLSGAVVPANVQEIDLPVANAENKTATSFTVKLYPAVSAELPPTLATAAMVRPVRPLLSNLFKLAIDSVSGVGVVSITPIVVTFTGNEKYPGRAQVSPIVVRVQQARMADFQKWLSSRATHNGTLEFLSPDMRSTALTIQLRGMTVTRIGTAPTTGAAQMSDVSISIAEVNVAEWKG
jgi:hypothetical protein